MVVTPGTGESESGDGMKTLYDGIGQPDALQQLRLLLCGGDVRRFHTVPVLQPQRIADHSWGVAQLMWLLTDGHCSRWMLMAALCHDLGEQIYGDMPAPAKRAMGVRETVSAHETQFLKDGYGTVFILTEEEKRILKLADCMEGMLACVKERALGNKWIIGPYNHCHAYTLEVLAPLNVSKPLSTEQLLFDAVQVLWEEANGQS